MKVLIARMNHETVLAGAHAAVRLGNDGPTYDAAAYEENKGKRTAMSAFIDWPKRAAPGWSRRCRPRPTPAGG